MFNRDCRKNEQEFEFKKMLSKINSDIHINVEQADNDHPLNLWYKCKSN